VSSHHLRQHFDDLLDARRLFELASAMADAVFTCLIDSAISLVPSRRG
jgi:hypothetical protein